jgi:hypothetical protein
MTTKPWHKAFPGKSAQDLFREWYYSPFSSKETLRNQFADYLSDYAYNEGVACNDDDHAEYDGTEDCPLAHYLEIGEWAYQIAQEVLGERN